jgi:predicted metal-binding membrane protein
VTDDPRELGRVRNPVLLLCAAAWIGLLLAPGLLMPAHGAAMGHRGLPLRGSLPMLLAMNPPASLLAGWGLMLVAMMSPALVQPIRHVRLCSFKRRRARATALFAAGYAAVWMAAGVILLAAALVIGAIGAIGSGAPNPYLPAAGALLLAVVWQLSPAKQRCLNRCHAHTELAAFGLAADLDALRFGATHGTWCAGSCWALMLAPLLLPRGHLAAMAIAAVLIVSERLEHPRPPRWRWRGLGKASRIVAAQARIRLQTHWPAVVPARPAR